VDKKRNRSRIYITLECPLGVVKNLLEYSDLTPKIVSVPLLGVCQ